MLRGRLKQWGPQIFLDGAAVARTRTGPNATGFLQPVYSVLVHLATEPQWQTSLNSDRKITGVAPPGATDIVPANGDAFASWSTEKHSLRLDIDPVRLERLAGEEFDKETFEIQAPRFCFVDKQFHSLALWMQRELENGEVGRREAIDALVTVFSTHLLRRYSSLGGRPSRHFNGGLPPASWRRVNDFIQAHLGSHVSLEQMAAIACLSPSHFSRTFRQTTGQSPHQFVMAARLDHARNLLTSTDTPITDIALASGFASNSHMTAIMRRTWNTTPTELRRNR